MRERAEDIQHLAEHFLQELANKYQRPVCRISEESYKRLFEHSWPGNVRELQHAIERAMLLCKSDTIDVEALPFGQTAPRAMAAVSVAGSPTIPQAPLSAPINNPVKSSIPEPAGDPVEASFEAIGRTIVNKVPEPKNGTEPFDVFAEVERAVVSAALTRTGGNKQAAANLLGIYRPRLYSMIKRHKLAGSDGANDPRSGIPAEEDSKDEGDPSAI